MHDAPAWTNRNAQTNQSPMAVEDVKCNGSKKRKRGSMKRKLLVDERVEVRSVEEGFLGSWHPGTVIHCRKQKRHVMYDNVLEEDGSSYVVDVVSVSPVLDGVSADSSHCNERGFIRPLPPLFEFGGWDLPFGLCVDVSYQEAWWEGVVFDHCNGMEERKVFFPDLGDEMKIGIHQMRITQEWDEATANWNPRGNWVFLELIEEYERESFVTVSVKQIWYDVRVRKEFETNIRDWTCNVKKDLWRDLVMEIVGDYYALTIQEILPALNLPEDFFKETSKLESIEATGNADSSMKNDNLRNSMDTDQDCGGFIPFQEKHDEASDSQIIADIYVPVPEKEDLVLEEPISPIQQIIPEVQNEVSRNRHSGRCRDLCWEPLMLSEVEFCPEVVDQYMLGCESKKIRELLKTKVRKHLAYLGWTIEWTEDKYVAGRRRYRYRSPGSQGHKLYTSILKSCKHVQQDSNANSLVCQNDTVESSILHLLSDQPLTNQDSVKVVVEPEFCPQAVVKYYLNALENRHADKRKWKLKAKQHLLAEGWIFDYPTAKRRRTLYKSPKNQTLGTLQGACRLYMKESIPKWTISGMRPLSESVVNEESVDHLDCDDLSQCVSQLLQMEPELHVTDGLPLIRSTANENRKPSRNSKASARKRRRNGLRTRVLRSSKRVQKVLAPGLSHQKPQNVLSWLIDSNTVLPRSKVFCKAKGGRNTHVAEGRINRDGIKCSCCQKMYSLGGFVNHAGANSNCRPSASILLKDGRSLLDCLIQVMHGKRKKETMEKPCSDLWRGGNDNICSVCQYGGELILCDQCPSAFHMRCLGLEDIPDGDWFCPSCRCGICSQIKIRGAEEGHFLTCIQCERKYHAGCLRNRSINKSRRNMANWFCRKECEQIYAGLHKLLGKPVAVDGDNLTWTLLKYVNSENRGVGSNENDYLAESYSKLNVALSVMHECFEPLQNPSSSRDLVEDVIFSRWSELNRTNFQGFYTILLERDEELISVATVRIYGEKVAELPLVGTRFQYRRLGMCRILMNELEKTLMHLGVERLVLPAVPGVLETWTNSFGFDKMTKFERSQFLDYTFLDFQGTVMCQKLLTKTLSPDSVLTTEIQPTPHDPVSSVMCKIEFDKSSSASEECQAVEEADESRMTDLPLVEYVSPLSTP